MIRLAIPFTIIVAACGGGQTQAAEPSGSGAPGDVGQSAGATGAGSDMAFDGGVAAATQPVADAAPPPAPYQFVLKNTAKTDLVFAIDKGWQPIIFAFTGKPPKAKSVQLFQTACTMSCDTPVIEMCPVCETPIDPENLRAMREAERAETRRETAPAGGQVVVPWDGQVFVYEKAPKEAKKKSCSCFRKAEPPAEAVTIRACGYRPATQAGKPPLPACADAVVTFPLQSAVAGPIPIELTFAR